MGIDNIDYQEIKQLIKGYTTNRPPVPSPNQKTEFEDELFDIFMDQLGRVRSGSNGPRYPLIARARLISSSEAKPEKLIDGLVSPLFWNVFEARGSLPPSRL